ncbi:centrosomal protein of 76 kDa-like [Glandiceps talaboti]
MTLPPEKISELKQIIHSQLTQMDIQSRVREVLLETIRNEEQLHRSKEPMSEQELMEALRQRGLVDDVMRQLQFDSVPEKAERGRPAAHFRDKDDRVKKIPLQKANIDPTRRYLYLQILGGKAFLEHLQEPEPLPGQANATFTLHINFRGQRFKSRPTACACEPDIQEGFLLELHKDSAGDAASMADSTAMLSICDPVHMVLIKADISGDTTLVSSHSLEWRSVLASASGRMNIPIELMGVGTESKVPVGVLELRLELIPTPTQMLKEDIITAQVALERNRTAERERLFLVYAKQWWREYLQIRNSHNNRLVKIFAQDENGTNRPVCSYVRPLRAGRLLDTPRESARFISAIGYERTSTVGSGGAKAELWSSMHAFLCKNKGDCEDHAVLLCSLLLGFGLNAYVCVGTKTKGTAHAWVMTLSTDGLVMFWESLTGQRYIHQPINPDDPPAIAQPQPQYPYRTIGCVFNHQCFYGNSQPSDAVELCRFDFYDESLWKAMSTDAIHSVCALGNQPSWPNVIPLIPSSLDSALVSNELELQLRALTTEHRRDMGLTCVWDDELCYLLSPALAAYELERTTGLTAGNEEFQQAIRRAVPDGHTFKGFPIQFLHRNARRAFATCLRSPVCEEIINCRGDHVRIAVRVRVFTYPESACAVWVMFACKYKSIL